MVKLILLLIGFLVSVYSIFFLSLPYDLIGFLVGFLIIIIGSITNKEESIESDLDSVDEKDE